MRVLLALSLVVAAACASASLPTREPDITGTVTHVSDDRSTILVEERPQAQSGSAKASVRITTSTHLWRDPGAKAAPSAALMSDIALGSAVRVWFDGPVAMSYPVQAKAGDIVIDASTQGASLYVLSKGGPDVTVLVNGSAAARVACNGGAAIRPRADLTPDLPWEVVVRTSDGAVLLDQRVTSLPKWLLVQAHSAGVSDAPIAGPFVPCP